MIKRPMLAAAASSEALDRLQYPLYVSPKLDGIRCYIDMDRGPVTRSLKPVPNEHIRKTLSSDAYWGLDGEIMLTDNEQGFGSIQSAVMSFGGTPDFLFWVFDMYPNDSFDDLGFEDRRGVYSQIFKDDRIVRPLSQALVVNARQARELATEYVAQGYEGIVLRDPKGLYKQGRSTLKQQGMIKYKEFSDAEGTVVGFEELLRNENEDERDNLGLAKRSDKKEGMVPGNTLGALVLRTSWGELRVGTGFDAALRDEIWMDRTNYTGRVVTFKYQTHGMQDLPRFPVFLHFRED